MTATREEIGEEVEHFLRSAFRIADKDERFHRDAQLFELGFVDSTGVVELIAFLESTFDVELQEEDVFSDEFTTINGISGVVHRRLSRAPSRCVPPDEGRELSTISE